MHTFEVFVNLCRKDIFLAKLIEIKNRFNFMIIAFIHLSSISLDF